MPNLRIKAALVGPSAAGAVGGAAIDRHKGRSGLRGAVVGGGLGAGGSYGGAHLGADMGAKQARRTVKLKEIERYANRGGVEHGGHVMADLAQDINTTVNHIVGGAAAGSLAGGTAAAGAGAGGLALSRKKKPVTKNFASTSVVGRKDAVEKGFSRQSVAPVLARRTAAAGRPGRKVVQTGVIGKGFKIPRLRKPPPAPRKPTPGNGLGAGITYHGPGQVGMRGRGSVQKGILSEVAQGLRAGHAVAGGGASLSGAEGMSRATRMATTTGLAGTVAGKQGIKAVKANPGTAAIGAGAGVLAGAGGLKAKQGINKRRYDPEDERRHRQGFYAGAGAAGGTLATGYGVRGIARDTRNVMRTPDVPAPTGSPKLLSGWGKVAFEDLDDKGKARVTAENAKRTNAHGAQQLAHEATRNLKSHKGVLVRGKPAALTLGGLAAIGGSAALHSHRKEPRYY